MSPSQDFSSDLLAGVLFRADSVFVETQPNARHRGRISGMLSVLQQGTEIFIDWSPNATPSSAMAQADRASASGYAMNFPLEELHSFKQKGPRLVMMGRHGVTHTPLFFEGGPGGFLVVEERFRFCFWWVIYLPGLLDLGVVKEFLEYMTKNFGLTPSAKDPSLYLVHPPPELLRSLEGLGLQEEEHPSEIKQKTVWLCR